MITRTLCASSPGRRPALASLGVISGALVLAACDGAHGTEFVTQGLAAPLELSADRAAPLPLGVHAAAATPGQPHAEPVNPGPAGRRDRDLPSQQSELLSAAEQGEVLWVDVSCCKANATENVAVTRQAMTDSVLPDSVAIFVNGSDSRPTAAVANWRDAAGLPRVSLVSR